MSVVGLNDVGVCAAEKLVNSEIDNWGTQNPTLHVSECNRITNAGTRTNVIPKHSS